MNNTSYKILLAEDDDNLGMVITDFLELKGYQVTHVPDGAAGKNTFAAQAFDIIILDVMMPHIDGFTLATHIRELDKEVPILFLSARAMKEDRIKGFRLGADDYITKPFSTEELSLRIEAILRRTKQNKQGSENILRIGDYSLDMRNLSLSHPAETRQLTKKEAGLLQVLSATMNNTVNRDLALMAVWGNDDYFSGRSMDVFISRLRKYLRHDKRVSIMNIHGTGFKLLVSN
jgi:DNA-binding response OmpR family regulator